MQPQILKVDNIYGSIGANGIRFYIDRLLQDDSGAYFFVDYTVQEKPFDERGSVKWLYLYEIIDDGPDSTTTFYYRFRIVEIPIGLAHYVIEMLKIQSMIVNAGNFQTGGGEHGGRESILRMDENGDFIDITNDTKVVRVEDL